MDGYNAFIGDTLQNLVSGLGVPGKDKAVGAQFYNTPPLSQATIDALFAKNWMAAKVIEIPADDMCREWRTWKADKAAVEALENLERTFKVRNLVNKALKLAFKDGGSAILIGTGEDPSLELNVASMRRGSLKYLHVVTRHELPFTEMEYDPASPWFGQAKEYRMFMPGGTFVPIHPSRVITFMGVMRADMRLRMDPWGDSVFDRLHDAVRDATSAGQAAASMLQEAKLDVVKIPGLSENINRPEYRAAVVQRFSLAMALKAINGALIFDEQEQYAQKTLTFQGLPEIMEKLLTMVAGAADMPVTRLLGRSPSGLNSTGRADLEGYYSMVRSKQETYLRPAMERLDEVLIRSALGRRPRGIYSEFRSLWSIGDSDKAEIDARRATAVEAYARSGLFTQEALQSAVVSQLVEDSFLPGIDDAVGRFPGVGPVPNQPAQPRTPKQQAANKPKADPATEE